MDVMLCRQCLCRQQQILLVRQDPQHRRNRHRSLLLLGKRRQQDLRRSRLPPCRYRDFFGLWERLWPTPFRNRSRRPCLKPKRRRAGAERPLSGRCERPAQGRILLAKRPYLPESLQNQNVIPFAPTRFLPSANFRGRNASVLGDSKFANGAFRSIVCRYSFW